MDECRHGGVEPLVEVRDLSVRFVTPRGDGARGERRQLQRRPRRGAVHPGRVRFRQKRDAARHDASAAAAPHADRGRRSASTARTCWRCGKRGLRDLRGGLVSMIFQEPMTALDPVYTIGAQIAETVRAP